MKKGSLIALAILGMFALSSCELLTYSTGSTGGTSTVYFSLISGSGTGGTYIPSTLTSSDMSGAYTFPTSGYMYDAINTAGDYEVYRITVSSGQAYRVLTAANGANTVDTVIGIYNSSGVRKLTDDDSGESTYSDIEFTARYSGTAFVVVGSYTTSMGDFQLDVDGGAYARTIVDTEE